MEKMVNLLTRQLMQISEHEIMKIFGSSRERLSSFGHSCCNQVQCTESRQIKENNLFNSFYNHSCSSKDEEIDLIDVESFYKEAPTEISKPVSLLA